MQQSVEIGGTGQRRRGGHLRQAVYKLGSPSSREQQICCRVVNNTHTNISQDDKFLISHTCGKRRTGPILLEYGKLRHPSVRILAVSGVLICVRNTSSKCQLSGWIITYKRVASCFVSPRGGRLKWEYQRCRQCKEILSDRKVLRCIPQNAFPQEAEKCPSQRAFCWGTAHATYSTSHSSGRLAPSREADVQQFLAIDCQALQTWRVRQTEPAGLNHALKAPPGAS